MSDFVSTDGVSAQHRLSYWNDLVCHAFPRVEVTSLLDGPFFGSILTDQSGVASMSYVPSELNRARADHSPEVRRLDELHATVAAAARYGVFRIEGGREQRNESARKIADKIRMMKAYDPTLGLYAAYAYAEAGMADQARSVQGYLHSTLNTDLCDLAMLSGRGYQWAPGRIFPFCPLLSQGWNMLRVYNVSLPEQVMAARDSLRPALWTTFDSHGMSIIKDYIRTSKAV